MNGNQKTTKTFKSELNLEMLHTHLNKAFIKQIGWSNQVVLEIDKSRKAPNEIRGTIHGTLNRSAIFEPAFLLKQTAENMYEFSYFVRGEFHSRSSSNGNLPSIFNGSLRLLVSSKIISGLSEKETTSYLSNQELAAIGL